MVGNKRLNEDQYADLISKMIDSPKDLEGASYLYKGTRIQISAFGKTTAERVAALYKRRRAAGECILCGKKITKINKVTKRLYRLCDYHRKKVDHRR